MMLGMVAVTQLSNIRVQENDAGCVAAALISLYCRRAPNQNCHYSSLFILGKLRCGSLDRLRGHCTTCHGHGAGHLTDRACEISTHMTHRACHMCCQRIFGPYMIQMLSDRRGAEGQSIFTAKMECAQTRTKNGARSSKSYIARRTSAMMGSPPEFYDKHIGFLSKCAASGRLSVLGIGLHTQLL